MQLQIKFLGARKDEPTPKIALYAFDMMGQMQKIATAEDEKLNLETDDARLGSVIALGPDMAAPSTPELESLATFKTLPQLLVWNTNPVHEIPPWFWRPWLAIPTQLAGTLSMCPLFPEDKVEVLAGAASAALSGRRNRDSLVWAEAEV